MKKLLLLFAIPFLGAAQRQARESKLERALIELHAEELCAHCNKKATYKIRINQVVIYSCHNHLNDFTNVQYKKKEWGLK